MKKYFLHDGNKESGGFSLAELSKMELLPNYHIWYDGLADWQPIENIEELRPFIKISREPEQPPQFTKTDNDTKNTVTEIVEVKAEPVIAVSEPVEAQSVYTNQDSIYVDPKDKLYPAWAFGISTILLPSIIASYYFASHNYKILGEKKLAKNIFWAGIVLTIIQLIILYNIAPSTTADENGSMKGYGVANYVIIIFANMYIALRINKFCKANYSIDLNNTKTPIIPLYKGKVFSNSLWFFLAYFVLFFGILIFKEVKNAPPEFDSHLLKSRLHQWDKNEKTSVRYFKQGINNGDSLDYYVNEALFTVGESELIVDSIKQMPSIPIKTLNYINVIGNYTLIKEEYYKKVMSVYKVKHSLANSPDLEESANNLIKAKNYLDSTINAMSDNN